MSDELQNINGAMQYSTQCVNNDYVSLSAVIYIHAIAQRTYMHELNSQFTIKQMLQSEYHLNDLQ